MTFLSGNPEEDRRRERLSNILRADFDVYEEVWLRHSLFRHRRVRADLVAIPKDERFINRALAFEVKGHEFWDIPSLTAALKQASDYVLATIEPESVIPEIHHGKRIMAMFVYPGIAGLLGSDLRGPSKLAYFAGMIQSAGAHRVGTAVEGNGLTLQVGTSELWVSAKGWRADAANLLSGQRQIGSQRFNIIDELSRLK